MGTSELNILVFCRVYLNLQKVCLKHTYSGFSAWNLLDFKITLRDYSLNRIVLHSVQNRIEGELANLFYLLVSTRAVIGQFSGPCSPVRPAKI